MCHILTIAVHGPCMAKEDVARVDRETGDVLARGVQQTHLTRTHRRSVHVQHQTLPREDDGRRDEFAAAPGSIRRDEAVQTLTDDAEAADGHLLVGFRQAGKPAPRVK